MARMHTLEPAPELVPAAVLARARLAPDAIALEDASASLSYAELVRRAEHIARRLAAHVSPAAAGGGPGKSGPDRIVAVCLERGVDVGPALLGVLLGNAAYLPIDPATPTARVAELISDSGARALVTSSRIAARLEGLSVPRIVLDAAESGSAAGPSGPSPSERPPASADLAYVLYTSGSTGKPKGVEVEHGSLAVFAHGMAAHYGLAPGDRVLQFASLAFDVAAEELWPTLIAGATVVLRDEAAASSFTAFTRFLAERRISVANLPAGFWQEWTAELLRAGDELPASLRLVIAGSERVSAAALMQWKRRFGERVRWINGYGPTETTVTATVYEPRADELDPAWSSVPIGFALPWVATHVLDAHGREVPAGVEGDLAIGGLGVARGYLGLAELTARRFVPDPFSTRPGARMYITGDRARRRADGALEFLGRDDDQVKLRGFRIELGEVEAALEALPGVRAAAACVREDAPGARMLVGYVTAAEGASPDVDGARRELARTLPEYMVPSAIVVLPHLPRTPGGKVDRRALPPPPRAPAGEAPRTPTEKLLAGLWRELLGLDAVGRDDHFFRLGGHSLLAMQLAGRLAERARVELAPRTVFEHPTLGELAAALDAGGANPWPAYPPMTRVDRARTIPLSFSQEPVWFLLQLEPGLLAYNTQFSVRFTGEIDPAAMRRALARLVERHEILRTTFHPDGDSARQVIEPRFEPALPVIDLAGLAPAEREARAESVAAELCARRFDVAKLPLVEWTLLRRASDDWELVQVEHHFIHDGWSIALLLGDIARAYAAAVAGADAALPTPAYQFADYVHWQRAMLVGERRERLREFWRTRLSGAPALLTLPTDRPRPEVQTFHGASEVLEIPPKLFRSLASLARREGFTPFQLLLTAFEILLARHSGQSDVVVASAAANRRTHEIEGIIGMLVNPVPIRVDLSGAGTVRDLARRVQRSALESFEHQDLPFEHVVQAAEPPRDFAYNPIFQVLFSFHDSPVPDLEFGAARGKMVYRYNGSAKFDMNLVVIPRGEQRVGRSSSEEDGHAIVEWEYNTDLFDRARVQRMVAHFRALLEGLEQGFDRPVGELSMLSAEELAALERANDTAAEFPRDAGLFDLFREAARKSPEALAASFGEERASYRELERLALSAAAALRARGVGRGDLVGVYVERSLSMVAALLGIAAAGAAYLPLDPALPEERLAYVLGDAFPAGSRRTVITEPALRGHLPAEFGPGVLDLATCLAPPPGASAPAADGTDSARGEDLAYVIYTSGSTGRPKGVEVTQRNLVNFLVAMRRHLAPGAGDVLVAVTTLSFDIAGLELYLPLCSGAAVHVATRAEASDARRLAELLEARGATHMQATPATWRMLLESGWAGSQRLVALCGGEALPLDLARSLAERVRALHNLYGPTETTIWSTVDAVPRGAREVTIGRPIGNTRLHVLGPAGELLPEGAAGELWIGGEGVARGYRGRAELTAQRFRADPFAPRDGRARMYATGDLVRRRTDGRIDYLGRLDQQVKLRGFRIELGEIEVVLRAQAGVLDAAVDLRELAPGDQRLIAWYVADPAAVPQEAALRAGLARSLPEYMLPSAFERLEAMPRTHNGKLDRKALSASRATARSADFVAPRGEIEQAVAEIFRGVLSLDAPDAPDTPGATGATGAVGARDRFFDLGGHSLTAMRAILRLEERFAVRVPPRDLMLQNVAQLAAAIAERRARGETAPAADPAHLSGGAPTRDASARDASAGAASPGETPGETGGLLSGLRGLFGKRTRRE